MASVPLYNPKQILCPVDMSDLSDLALKYAHMGAQMFNAELTILNAVHFEYPRYLSREMKTHVLEQINLVKAETNKHLAEHTDKVLGKDSLKGIATRYMALDMEPAQAVLHASQETKADLVVMGTRGHSGFKHWMLGSVAEKVIHSSKAPVFIIRQKMDDLIDTAQPESRPRINHILCPCNLSDSAAQALKIAASLAKRMDARLTVLHSVKREAPDDKERLETWTQENLPESQPFNAVIRSGEAADQTLAAAKELASDLIVIGICHRPFGQGTVVGRTTERVARYAPVPVLAVPFFSAQ